MATRRFRAYATKEDLYAVFTQLQENLKVYYTPTYSDIGAIQIDDITKIETFGTNRYGSHIGYNQFLVFHEHQKCVWRQYQCKSEHGVRTRYSSHCDENQEYIDIDLGGVHQSAALFPTTISTIHYDVEASKELYNSIRKIFRKLSVKSLNGYFICPNAYEKRADFRFCIIDIKSPVEYDFNVE
ncbi:hypothetical protein [Paenibacillus antibioticophila]|uniref:hypothetical protein n=1 Tax=Paenibacillus antibioticophila TaxID=1274374 RepID=UPI000AAE683C|nr:hypothetical protein [Paenibacillus antibioticophila]